jgi:hypothetical protein
MQRNIDMTTEPSNQDIMKHCLTSKLTFGKYKGTALKKVIEDAPDYIAWAEDEIEWFELDEEAENYLMGMLNYDDDHTWHEAYEGHKYGFG